MLLVLLVMCILQQCCYTVYGGKEHPIYIPSPLSDYPEKLYPNLQTLYNKHNATFQNAQRGENNLVFTMHFVIYCS